MSYCHFCGKEKFEGLRNLTSKILSRVNDLKRKRGVENE